MVYSEGSSACELRSVVEIDVCGAFVEVKIVGIIHHCVPVVSSLAMGNS